MWLPGKSVFSIARVSWVLVVIKLGSREKVFFQIPGFRGRFICSIGLCHCFPGGVAYPALWFLCSGVSVFFICYFGV